MGTLDVSGRVIKTADHPEDRQGCRREEKGKREEKVK